MSSGGATPKEESCGDSLIIFESKIANSLKKDNYVW